jgi:polyisoprenoid-binding protein YceI
MKPLLLLLTLTFTATAGEYHLELTPQATKINWTLGDVLHTVHGTFKLKRGDIHFDTESGRASGEVVVDATSGESGSGARDSRMQKNVLESSKYPEVSFAPDRVEGKAELAGTSNVKLHGIFKIHGAAHEITVPVQITAQENHLTANIKFDVPYVAWGMKDPSTFILKVSKSVEIEMEAAGRVSASADKVSLSTAH